jgi:hypothetical protein
MGTGPLDVEAIYSGAMGFVREDLAFGLQSEGSLSEGIKYPLRRLRGMGAISDEDREQLGRLVAAVGAGADVSPLAAALWGSATASPLAVALAGLARAAATDPARKEQNLLVLAGAIAAAYLSSQLLAPGAADRPPAPEGIVAAAGGAIAGKAVAFIREIEAQLPPRA